MRTKIILKKGENGVAAIEFALILPFLLMVLFGIIEFSILLYNKAMITNASREGARAGVVYRPDHVALNEAEIENVVFDFARAHLITFGEHDDPDVTATHTDSLDGEERNVDEALIAGDDGESVISSGEPLEVRVDYTYDFLILPSFASELLETSTITAVTVMRYE
jgi:hypothetical protein